MTSHEIKEIILKNTSQNITLGSSKYLAVDAEKLDTISSSILSYIQLSLCEAYKIGQADGYDCARIDSGKQ